MSLRINYTVKITKIQFWLSNITHSYTSIWVRNLLPIWSHQIITQFQKFNCKTNMKLKGSDCCLKCITAIV